MAKEKMVKKMITTTSARVTVLEMPSKEFQEYDITQIGEHNPSDFWSLNAVELWHAHNKAVLVGGAYIIANVMELTVKTATYEMTITEFLERAREV